MKLDAKTPVSVYGIVPENCRIITATRSEDSKVYYYRTFTVADTGKRLKINLPTQGTYVFSVPFIVTKITDLRPSQVVTVLPKPERNRVKPIKYFHKKLNGTPARIFTLFPANFAPVQIDPEKMNSYPVPFARFVILHEKAHQLYKTEWKADLKALHDFCAEGWNASNAYEALVYILKHRDSEEVEKRINNLKQAVKFTREWKPQN